MPMTDQKKQDRPRVRVRVEDSDSGPSERTFVRPFTIGRDEECGLRIDSRLVSRVHAKVAFDDGHWWVYDLGSSNGVLVDSRRVDRVRVDESLTVQLGEAAPRLSFFLEAASGALEATHRQSAPAEPRRSTPLPKTKKQAGIRPDTRSGSGRSTDQSAPGAPSPGTGRAQDQPDPLLSNVIRKYFAEDSEHSAGDQTMLIRRAYKNVATKEKRKYTRAIAAVGVLALIVLGYGLLQRNENAKLEAAVAEMFYTLKQTDLEIATLAMNLEEDGGTTLRDQLQQIRSRRDAQAARYDGLVQELGLYRRLSDEEQLIFTVARAFNESQVEIPAGFVEEVKSVLHDFWLTPAGRRTYREAILTAQDEDYVEGIVDTFREHGLPPQFFYVALEESRYDLQARGPLTRFGRPKGLWQFIPETARRFDLFVPELDQNADLVVPEDERHHFEKSTEAAAAYVQELYVTLAQASGLLVMASYNWGERRVVRRLRDLPGFESVDESAVPEDPRSRNYWTFLLEYEEQLPRETKDYVLKIFAAAVIGEDPEFFSFAFGNPLEPYLPKPASG